MTANELKEFLLNLEKNNINLNTILINITINGDYTAAEKVEEDFYKKWQLMTIIIS